MKDKLYKNLPNVLQNVLISIFNILAYRKRYGGKYKEFKKLFFNNRNLTRSELLQNQRERFFDFIQNANSKSVFYANLFKEITDAEKLENISQLPFVDKEMLRANINDIVINTNENLIKSKTGGTTGKSLEVKYTKINMQERFAMLDDFRSRFGYKLGKKTAWFSGKNLLTSNDIKQNRFWKKDYLHKVKYYSTFHIKSDYLKYYVEDLIKFRPQYLVGFPSTILEIAKYGLSNKYDFPEKTVKAVFPTAESITNDMRSVIEKFFKTKLYDQYASSEGAPFILECEKGSLHLELQSGVFEVLDENDQQTRSGRLVLTSFTTEGTPLIRYDIGDTGTLAKSSTHKHPVLLNLTGRTNDVARLADGKVVPGLTFYYVTKSIIEDAGSIKEFLIVQTNLDKFKIEYVSEAALTANQIQKILSAIETFVGKNLQVEFEKMSILKRNKSGKLKQFTSLV
jgi:phenylacetate-CoA ligase